MRVSIKFVKQDMWIGIFWRHYSDYKYGKWHIWISVIPCFPIHIIYPVAKEKEKGL